nr:reverse transcriptase domain-containing protein [Tanacetum cinerariifolium]
MTPPSSHPSTLQAPPSSPGKILVSSLPSWVEVIQVERLVTTSSIVDGTTLQGVEVIDNGNKGDNTHVRKNEANWMENRGKLGPTWGGPNRVTEAYQNGSYKLQTMEVKEVSCT